MIIYIKCLQRGETDVFTHMSSALKMISYEVKNDIDLRHGLALHKRKPDLFRKCQILSWSGFEPTPTLPRY